MLLDVRLPHVQSSTLAPILKDFALPLREGITVEWLAIAVRRALAICMTDRSEGPDRKSDADIRNEMKRLAGVARTGFLDIFQRDGYVDRQIFDFAFSRWDGSDGIVLEDGSIVGDPTDMRRFRASLGEMEWLATFLEEASNSTESRSGPWRSAERKQTRVERGQYLAPIFEFAFGQPVSANNYPNDARHKSPTAFMEFYSRMVMLTFGAQETSNQAEVVKAACRLHRKHPARFAEGIIPDM